MDTGASSHLADNTRILISFSNSSIYPSVFVGNGNSIPVTHTGHSFLHTSHKSLHLNHILVIAHIIKNLISIHKFTRDYDVSVEFDAYSFSVKGLPDPKASSPLRYEIPFTKLYNQTLTYEHLRVFGCLCYPHIDGAHKLEPRSTPWIFLGYPANHHGYRCLDLASNKIIISRHVRFDEDIIPFGNFSSSIEPTYNFLLPPIQTTTNVPITKPFGQHVDKPNSPIMAYPTTPPTCPPPSDTPPSNSSTHIPTSVQTQSHAQSIASHTLIPTNNSSQTVSTHLMVTRAKAGIFKPLKHMNCHVTTISPLPRSHVHALRDPNWKEAMLDEYNTLITNRTCVLVPRPTNVNVVHSMWLFKHKFHADGSLSRYKARLVANRRNQQQGIDYDKTFSPVVKLATIRTVLSLLVSCDWPIHQFDVKNAFLHGQLSKTVYMHQPPRFVDSARQDYVCHLQKLLYGLKQAPRAWFQRFASFATRIDFQHSKTNASLFVYHHGFDITYLLLYVHDKILTASSTALLQPQWTASGLFLSQSKFAEKILEKAHMQHCNPCRTPVDTESKIGLVGALVADPTLYRSLVGALQYLTFIRPDLSYAVQHVCLYMHDPQEPHLLALKRILLYVCGTLDHGLQLHASSMTQLVAYIDADWAGCPVTRKSTSGYCVFLEDDHLSWSAKRHVTLSRSSAEAEYRGVANVVAKTHQRTKHIEIDIHFVRDYVASGQVRVLHVPSRFNFADIFTKGLLTALFINFRSSLNVRRLPAQTAGNYDVTKFIHGDTNVAGSSTLTPLTPDELKVDKIILSLIFTTLSDALQKRLVVAHPKSAKEAWGLITDIVKDNKRSHTSALKAESRSIKLGTLSMEAYFQKIESLVTILTSLESHVNDEDVVH
ncbi:ribonuclease H-like domain-containing protein [Tanacetum coccineum]